MNAILPSPRGGVMNLSRRALLMGLGAGSLVLAAGGASAQQRAFGGAAMPGGLRDAPNLFVALARDGTVTILCHRSEMGQGVRTGMPLIVAEEMEADWARVAVGQAPGDEARFGNQDTDGSRSTRQGFLSMRRVGAAVRQMLETAAAERWRVPVAEVAATNHTVVHRASGRSLGFGDLAEAASALPVPDRATLRLKDPAAFRYLGKGEAGLVDNRAITTGRAGYGIDTRMDGMLHAVIARPPVLGGKVRRFDAAAAAAIPGVLRVVPIEAPAQHAPFQPLGGIAIVAENTWAALKGREALVVEWDAGPHGAYNSTAYRAELEAAARSPGQVVRDDGDAPAVLAAATRRVEAEYYVPHLSQAPMEPPVATARVTADAAEVWASVQAPEATRKNVADRLGLPLDKVTVNVTLLGGGFGRKSKPDFVVEAAILSRAMDGRPVKVTWTREDDLRNGYLHMVSLDRLEAALGADGKPQALRHRTVGPSITSTFVPTSEHQGPFELAMSATGLPLAIPNYRVENPAAKAHTRIGWFRSVANIPHAFAVQSFIAEMAHAAGRDPKDYLLELIGPDRRIDPGTLADRWNYGEDPALYTHDTARLRGVIEKVAAEARWGRAMPARSGLGIAALRSFASYTAAAVEVSVDARGNLSIPRVDIAIDCGPVVNPERVRSQLEGAVVQGIGLAMLGEISFADGATEQVNFDTYELARMDTAPREIHAHIIPAGSWDEPMGGVGEPGVPVVAPALTNAIFAAIGKRIRTLPIRNQLAG
ncbi:xanthine dehydrogenase family protein molybdopterin-binding subunit [Rhodovarius crocodyli]|uniref:Xanthine dehydrogenase family protein molybdopterin-binding subunit n=1 Tax=Rhodovarius crocodyli TaxID=1979269 RepID=A0A437M2F6_9PROT|nr:xanthine dehydrogenase family protein molybdopterin-binding subunit [Rhodovarius crocodyli]RVT91766.1 xanthine dehydrogenase family protein molybdopterin-binding subunit [Rhodovarius crocodyli]